jgi:multiple sugar transport system permease protein
MAKTTKRTIEFDNWGYAFVAPFILVFAIFSLYPVVYTLILGFTNANGMSRSADFIGLKKFFQVIAPESYMGSFWNGFANTWVIWGYNFVPQIFFALLLAVWFTDIRLRLKGVGFFKTVFYLPNIIPQSAVAVLFNALFYYPIGPVNQTLAALGLSEPVKLILATLEQVRTGEPMMGTSDLGSAIQFFRSVVFSQGLVSFIQWWLWYGNTLIIVGAGISGIPISLYESAYVDGANSRQIFFKITLPSLRPVMLYILLTSMIGGMQMFDIPFMVGPDRFGNPKSSILTTALYIYNRAFKTSDQAGGAAASFILFLITLALCLVLFYAMRDKDAAKARKMAKITKKAMLAKKGA